MKKHIASVLFIISAIVITQNLSAEYQKGYVSKKRTSTLENVRPGKNGKKQRVLGGKGGRQLAPQVNSEDMGMHDLQQGNAEGYSGIPTTTAIGGNGGVQTGYGYVGESADKGQYRYNQ